MASFQKGFRVQLYVTKSEYGTITLAVLRHLHQIFIITRATENGAQNLLLLSFCVVISLANSFSCALAPSSILATTFLSLLGILFDLDRNYPVR